MIDENEFIEWFNSDSGFRMVPPKHYLCMIGKSEVEMCMDEFFKYQNRKSEIWNEIMSIIRENSADKSDEEFVDAVYHAIKNYLK